MGAPTFTPLLAMDTCAMALRQELMHKGTGVGVSVMQPGPIYTKAVVSILDSATDPDLSDLYPVEKDLMMFMTEDMAKGATSPQVTSDALVDAVLSTRPWPRYFPNGTRVGYVLGHIFPTAFTDYIVHLMKPTGVLKDPAVVEEVRQRFLRDYMPRGMENTE